MAKHMRGTCKATVAALLSGVAMMLLGGCAGLHSGANGDTTGGPVKATLQGRVMGGQQPVSGATLQLYAPAIGSAGSASMALLPGNITTDANGNFTFTGDYTCPTSSSYSNQVYLVSSGGNPGLGAGVSNGVLFLAAALGTCSNLTSSTYIDLNEETTVAMAYGLSSYITDAAHVSATSANSAALTAGFALANELVNFGTGRPGGSLLPSGSYVPAPKLNTLADVLSACVNTSGSTASGSACANLFSAAGVTNSSNTLLAAVNVARNTSTNVATLFALSPPAAPFQPVLASAPSDWTMKVETLTWATPSALVYGSALGSTQLNASATVPGTIAYTPPSGTVPTESETLAAVFTPTDMADYPSLTAMVPLTVTPTPATISLATSAYTVNETDGSVTLYVTRSSNNPNGMVTVNYATANGTGTAGTTYTPVSGTLTWTDQDLTVQTITIPVLNQGLSGTSRTFTLTLSAATGPATIGTSKATITVLDGTTNPAGTIAWSASTYAATETTNIVAITATRTGGSTGEVIVNWNTMDGTAKSGTDYSLSADHFEWASGDTSPKSVNLSIANPNVYGGTRTFYVVMNDPTNGANIGPPSTAAVVINDNLTNAAGAIQFAQATYNTTENAGSVTLGLTRTTGSTGTVTATVTNSAGSGTNGVDYTAKTSTVTWAAGDDTSTQYVTVPILNPGVVGGSRYFYANISSVSGGAVKGAPSQVVIAIDDSDAAGSSSQLQITQPSWVAQENGGSAVVHVSRTGSSTGAVSVNYATSTGTLPGSAVAGTDYTTKSGTLSWAANDTSDKLITVPVLDQHLDGGYVHTFMVTISGATGGAVLGNQTTALVNIVMNDTGDGQVSFISPTSTIPENTGYIKLLVERTTDMTGAATVQYKTANGTAANGTDYTAVNGTLTWADGDSTARVIQIPILDPGITTGGTKSFTIALSSPTGATLGTNTVSTVNVVDNDSAVNYCPTPASNPTLGTLPTTSCSGLTLAGTTAANGFAQCSANFNVAGQSGSLVTAPGTTSNGSTSDITALGANDFFFGQAGISYNVNIPATANLSLSNDVSLKSPCTADTAGSIGAVPMESQGNTPYFEVIAISSGSIINYGTLNTYPLVQSTANNYLPSSFVILNNNTSANDQVTNFGSIGDFYVTAGMTDANSGFATFNPSNQNSLTLGYDQETYAAIFMYNGTITNAPGAYLRGDDAVWTGGPNGTLNNYGTMIGRNDGYLGSWTVNNYSGAGMGLDRNAYAASHSSGTTNNWGYMISGDYGVEMSGRGIALNTYGGPAIPGETDFDGNPVYGGEMISIAASTSCVIQMDSQVQQANLVSRTIGGTTYLPIIEGLMCGGYTTTTAVPNLNTLNFNFTGLSLSDYYTLTQAIAASAVTGPYGTYYTGSVTLQGHLYEWVNYGYVNFTGIAP